MAGGIRLKLREPMNFGSRGTDPVWAANELRQEGVRGGSHPRVAWSHAPGVWPRTSFESRASMGGRTAWRGRTPPGVSTANELREQGVRGGLHRAWRGRTPQA